MPGKQFAESIANNWKNSKSNNAFVRLFEAIRGPHGEAEAAPPMPMAMPFMGALSGRMPQGPMMPPGPGAQQVQGNPDRRAIWMQAMQMMGPQPQRPMQPPMMAQPQRPMVPPRYPMGFGR